MTLLMDKAVLLETLQFICIVFYSMELEFYLNSFTCKSFSNVIITEVPYVNECITVANMRWMAMADN